MSVLGSFFKAINKILSAILSFLKKNFIAAIFATLVGIGITLVYNYFRGKSEDKENRNLAYDRITAIVSNKNYGDDIRKIGAIGLGLMNKLDEIDSEIGEIVGLNEVLEEFEITNEAENLSTNKAFIEIADLKKDEKLVRFDRNYRTKREILNAINELRRQKSWFKSTELTGKEKALVEELKVVEIIDATIDSLYIISQDYTEETENFESVTRKFLSDIGIFQDRIEIRKNNQDKFHENVIDLKNSAFEAYYKLNVIEDASLKVKKYEFLIKNIVTFGKEKSKAEFVELSKDTSNTLVIRINSIEALGVIGGDRELGDLMELLQDSSYEVRMSALKSICMIVSENQSYAALELFDLESYRDRIFEDLNKR